MQCLFCLQCELAWTRVLQLVTIASAASRVVPRSKAANRNTHRHGCELHPDSFTVPQRNLDPNPIHYYGLGRFQGPSAQHHHHLLEPLDAVHDDSTVEFLAGVWKGEFLQLWVFSNYLKGSIPPCAN